MSTCQDDVIEYVKPSCELFEITPWCDDDLWQQMIDVAYQGPAAFARGLDWVAICSSCHKGPAHFEFHKSLEKRHVDYIIKTNSDAFLRDDGQLVVYHVIY